MIKLGQLAISIVSYKKCWNEIETGAYFNRHITNDTLLPIKKEATIKAASFFISSKLIALNSVSSRYLVKHL
ncbi:hypothetical protein P9E08_04655 [Bacillus mojavensis]|uniref:hypothetical protein n=1 Tax=Bacillus mojavensis TaxID=72360 RepID=UPI002DBDB0BA|nr:hypothetical protein [Bacillus mojavensis]MEC1624668.1 hypothetical protein [Bacillus mojavensis]